LILKNQKKLGLFYPKQKNQKNKEKNDFSKLIKTENTDFLLV
jgi:hypothetical protein